MQLQVVTQAFQRVSRQLLAHQVSGGWQLGSEAVSMLLLGMPH